MPIRNRSLVISTFCLLSFFALSSLSFADIISGQPWVFGDNFYGELGIGSFDNIAHPYPTQPIGVDKVVKACFDYNCAAVLLADGTVRTCGINDVGQLGDGTTTDSSIFVPVLGLDNVIDLVFGWINVAVKSDGSVWQWGVTQQNVNGSLLQVRLYQPVRVENIGNVTHIAQGWDGPVALKSDGTVWHLSIMDDGTLQPTQIEGLSNIVVIASGSFHFLALDSKGQVWAWGDGSDGQLGNGEPTRKPRLRPARVKRLSGVIAISACGSSSMALKSNGTVKRWGRLAGERRVHTLPIRVKTKGRAVAISTGYVSAHFVKEDGSLWSFGDNWCGQLGDGTTEYRRLPVKAIGLENVVSVYDSIASTLAVTAPPASAATK